MLGIFQKMAIQRRSGLLDENSNDTMYLKTSSNDKCSTEVHLSVESSSDSPVDEQPAESRTISGFHSPYPEMHVCYWT